MLFGAASQRKGPKLASGENDLGVFVGGCFLKPSSKLFLTRLLFRLSNCRGANLVLPSDSISIRSALLQI